MLPEGKDHLVVADLERQWLPLFRFIQKLIKTPSAVFQFCMNDLICMTSALFFPDNEICVMVLYTGGIQVVRGASILIFLKVVLPSHPPNSVASLERNNSIAVLRVTPIKVSKRLICIIIAQIKLPSILMDLW